MRYASVCSGIEAATMAWHPLGWEPVFYSDIEAFPQAALKHHYPDVPLYGDFTKMRTDNHGSVDLLVGGTPCQSFSNAGLRAGLADPRGDLMLGFGRLAAELCPQWLVWENVPGVLSSNGGRDFGTFVGMLAELGYGFAYRVLDAQFFGLAQRRRRVFVVGYLGDWRPPAAVLFERHSLSGDPAPGREAREDVAGSITASAGKRGGTPDCASTPGQLQPVAPTLLSQGNSTGGDRPPGTTVDTCESLIPITMAHGQPNAEIGYNRGPTLTCNHEAPIVCHGTQDPITSDIAHPPAVCFTGEVTHSLDTCNNGKGSSEDGTGRGVPTISHSMAVRRLTPVECERLQGFPDNFTKIPYNGKPADRCPDGPRYKALGNSMAVPVMRWIGERIDTVSELMDQVEITERANIRKTL